MSDSRLPPELLASRPWGTIETAIAEGRLGHALILHGEDHDVLRAAAETIAARLLATEPEQLPTHPDFFERGPTGKARQIKIGNRQQGDWPYSIRSLIEDLQLTAQRSERKVAIIREVDRLNNNAANAFLKTLEEPPAGTTLLLLTTSLHDLLPTILSRCLQFRLPHHPKGIDHPDWQRWLADYRQWIERLCSGRLDRNSVADLTMAVYGLITRFMHINELLEDAHWKEQGKDSTLSDEEMDAVKAGHIRAIRSQMLAELQRASRDTAFAVAEQQGSDAYRKLEQCNRLFEKANGLMQINLNAGTAIEHFLLGSMRVWVGG